MTAGVRDNMRFFAEATWNTSGNISSDTDFPTSPSATNDVGGSIARWIIQDIFELDMDRASTNIGGNLKGYDIRSRDAYEMVKLSLAEELIYGKFYECYATEDGKVEFVLISNTKTDNKLIPYYSIPTTLLKLKCDNVVVQGYDPPPIRRIGGSQDMIVYGKGEVLGEGGYGNDGTDAKISIFGQSLGTNACKYNMEGIIEYSGGPEYSGKGGDSNTDPFERVIAYIYSIRVPFYKSGLTDVTFSSKSARFYKLTGMGNLLNRQAAAGAGGDGGGQGQSETLCQGNAVKSGHLLPDSDHEDFLGVKDVYIFGFKLDNLRVADIVDSNGNVTSLGSDFVAVTNSNCNEAYRLSMGEDYVVNKAAGSGWIISFIGNVSSLYSSKFGGAVGTGAMIRLDPSCMYDYQGRSADVGIGGFTSGRLKDATCGYVSTSVSYLASLYPTGDASTAYVVRNIIVVYDWNRPSIVIKDLRKDVINVANLQSVQVSYKAIKIRDEPAPMCHCSDAGCHKLDPADVVADDNPNTVQDFSGSEYATVLASLEKNDVRVTMPFADENQVCGIARAIYDIQNDAVDDVVYICSPDSTPKLGASYRGGVVNSIDYSYQDSSQYTISVQVGPQWKGIGSWDNSIYKMKTERVTQEGEVTAVSADNASIQVRLETLGNMSCVNGTKYKLEKGDVVSVTVFNNPVAY